MSGLNQFSFGNIGRDQQSRLAAPLILAWIQTFFLLFLIRREWIGFIEKRKAFLTSREWVTKPQSKTVLLSGIPDEYCSVEAIQKLTAHLTGGVGKIWLAQDVKNLSELYERQMKAARRLEKADIKVIKLANKRVRKGKVPKEGDAATEEKDGDLASRYIPAKKMPSHRLGKIPFFGKKVDSIAWAEQEIESVGKELVDGRANPSKFPYRGAAFILFNDQIDAHIFAQAINEKTPLKLKLATRYVNVNPDDVIWSNVSRNGAANRTGTLLSIAATTAITIFWTPITTFIVHLLSAGDTALH